MISNRVSNRVQGIAKWIIRVCLALVVTGVFAAETRLVKGVVEHVNGRTGELQIKNKTRTYIIAPGVEIQSSYTTKERLSVYPGLNVSLYSEDGDNISRIVIHGPYSLLRKREQH